MASDGRSVAVEPTRAPRSSPPRTGLEPRALARLRRRRSGATEAAQLAPDGDKPRLCLGKVSAETQSPTGRPAATGTQSVCAVCIARPRRSRSRPRSAPRAPRASHRQGRCRLSVRRSPGSRLAAPRAAVIRSKPGIGVRKPKRPRPRPRSEARTAPVRASTLASQRSASVDLARASVDRRNRRAAPRAGGAAPGRRRRGRRPRGGDRRWVSSACPRSAPTWRPGRSCVGTSSPATRSIAAT
jgi:hypothetical protein